MPLELATWKAASLKGSTFQTGVEEMFREVKEEGCLVNNSWRVSESVVKGQRGQ